MFRPLNSPARLDVSAPFRGAPSTVALIKRYALESQSSPDVRLLAEEIVSELQSKDYGSEIKAIYNFIIAHTRYANDPRTVELVKRPTLVIRELASGKVPSLDCDDLVTLLAALYLSLGRRVRIVTMAQSDVFVGGHRQYSHVFLQVQEPFTRVWISVDPVAAEKTRRMLRTAKAFKVWSL